MLDGLERSGEDVLDMRDGLLERVDDARRWVYVCRGSHGVYSGSEGKLRRRRKRPQDDASIASGPHSWKRPRQAPAGVLDERTCPAWRADQLVGWGQTEQVVR